jgi:predicted nucleic acid-binding protein
MAKWLTRELDENRADQVIADTQKCGVVPLDTPIALLAADLLRQYRLATADASAYASARQQRADLLTCDGHFAGLSGVVLFAK